MTIDICYKHIKHGYVRIGRDEVMRISLPWWRRFDQSLKQRLIDKGEELLIKHRAQKKKMTPLHGGGMNNGQVMIWGKASEKSDLGENVEKHLRKICWDEGEIICDEYARSLGIDYHKLTIKKMRSRRGSCSSKQNINLNFALVHVDPKFLRYVAIHEVCHLKEKNHSKRFWDLVEGFCPEYKEIRKELRGMRLG